jgi:hypothetical protein
MAARRKLAERGGRKTSSLSSDKAKEIMRHGGIDRIGGGFASAKQRRFIGWVAGGRKNAQKRG